MSARLQRAAADRAATIIRVPVVMWTLIAGAACSESLGVTVQGLQSHRAQWEAAGITAYAYDYHKQCECIGVAVEPVRIEVQAGSISRVSLLATGQPLETFAESLFPTIDGLFDQIDEAVGMNAESLVVTYDPALGYPTLINVDYRRDVGDDEFIIRASNLEPR